MGLTINSLTKTPVSFDAAQALVRHHLGSAQHINTYSELTEGFFNSAYRLELQDGRSAVLKVAPPPNLSVLRYERDILRTEVEVLRTVKACTEMPVPEIWFHDPDCRLLPAPCYMMDWVEGQPLNKLRPKLPAEAQAALDRRTGKYLRQMNAIQGPDFGYYAQAQTRRSRWSEAFDLMLTNVLQDGLDAGVILPLPYDEIRSLAQRYSKVLDEVTTPALVHWDLWDGNIFINPHSLQISGIIDFERSLWADPLMEVNFGAFGFNPDFIAGYGLPMPLSDSQQTRRTLYNIYLFLIMVIECTYRQYPTPDQENWARGRLVEEIQKLD